MRKSESLTREIDIIRDSFYDYLNDDMSWVVEVYDDHVVAEVSGDYFRIPYSSGDDEIVFGSRAEWQEVEREWSAKNTLKILKKSDTELRVGNYLALFGGKDLVGETFTSKTDFESRYTKTGQLYVDWEHGMDWEDGAPGRDDILGVVDWKTAKIDNRGLWVERALDRQSEYMAYLETLIEADIIGSSSEATGKAERHSGVITKWPLKRDALTVTPMEPRMLTENTLQAVKALVGKMPSLKALLPEAGVTSGEVAGGDTRFPYAYDSETKLPKKKGVNIMTELTVEQIQHEAREALLVEQAAETKAAEAIQQQVKTAVEAALDDFAKLLPPVNDPESAGFLEGVAPGVVHRSDLGDVPEAAYCRFLRTGDQGALQAFAGKSAVHGMDMKDMSKASNATDMNITTAGDGGNAVPTGHYQGIIAKKSEGAIEDKFQCMDIPGKGTTVNLPYDNEDDGEWIATSESGTFDQDAPDLGIHAMTLVLYSKQVNLTYQLLEDEDSKLMAFLENWVGRGLAKTKNSLLLTEVGTSGTAYDEFASATAIAFGEPENLAYHNDLSDYLDDTPSVGWVMKSGTLGAIRILKGDQRQYAYGLSAAGPKDLLGYPVVYSSKAGAMTAALKPVYFGNWNYVGKRDGSGIGFLRDPYSLANKGWVNLFYYYRTVYKVIQAGAIGYGQMATA